MYFIMTTLKTNVLFYIVLKAKWWSRQPVTLVISEFNSRQYDQFITYPSYPFLEEKVYTFVYTFSFYLAQEH